MSVDYTDILYNPNPLLGIKSDSDYSESNRQCIMLLWFKHRKQHFLIAHYVRQMANSLAVSAKLSSCPKGYCKKFQTC